MEFVMGFVFAAKIGAQRESVSRAVASLRDARALKMDGRTIIITDPAKLRRYCER